MLNLNRSLKIVYAFIFLVSACDGMNSGGNSFEPDHGPCKGREKDRCFEGSSVKCVWNVDQCIDGFKNSLAKPDGLKKVKELAVSNSICAIDEKNELWCFTPFNGEFEIYPHASKKYKSISMWEDVLCAIRLDGSAECFQKGEPISAPKSTEKFISANCDASGKSCCALDTQGKMHCVSDMGRHEKIATKFNKGSSKGKKLWLTADNSIQIQTELDQIDQYVFYKKKVLGSPGYKPDILTYSPSPRSTCWIKKSNNTLECENLDTGLDISSLKGKEISLVANNQNRICVVGKSDNKLECSGSKSMLKPLPTEKSGKVKKMAFGALISCYTDLNDELHCTN